MRLTLVQFRIPRLPRQWLIGVGVFCCLGLSGAAAVGGAAKARAAVTEEAVLLSPAQTPPVVELVAEAQQANLQQPEAEPAAYIEQVVPGTPRILWMEVTAYCPCKKCCGPKAKGITASGRKVSYNRGRFVAADTKVLPFGTQLRIPGYHEQVPVEVIDRGGAIKGHKLDVYFPSHQRAREWGRQWLPVEVVE